VPFKSCGAPLAYTLSDWSWLSLFVRASTRCHGSWRRDTGRRVPRRLVPRLQGKTGISGPVVPRVVPLSGYKDATPLRGRPTLQCHYIGSLFRLRLWSSLSAMRSGSFTHSLITTLSCLSLDLLPSPIVSFRLFDLLVLPERFPMPHSPSLARIWVAIFMPYTMGGRRG
jgi:hypothetical protein